MVKPFVLKVTGLATFVSAIGSEEVQLALAETVPPARLICVLAFP